MSTFRVNNGVVIDYTSEGWDEYKKWLDGTYSSLLYGWVDEGLAYSIIAVDGPFYRSFSINKVDAADFEAHYKTNTPKPIVPPTFADDFGHLEVTIAPPSGSRVDVVSLNWCDKTTWYESSEAVENEMLVDSGDGLTFNSANPNWIDITHGKLTGEDTLAGNGLVPVIKANGVDQTEDDPFGGDTHDFSIDYAAGTVTFHSAPATPVTASYHHENGSKWVIKPHAGKVLRLTMVEVQFSKDIIITDTLTFQAYGKVQFFAPHLTPDPYPVDTLIPIGEPTVYKTMMDYINEASGSYPEIPAMGGEVRGTGQPIQIYRWPYAERASTDLHSSLGMEIQITLHNDMAFGGECAVATFYGMSQNE